MTEVGELRVCETCGNEMQHLADLPDTARFDAARVFRCRRCNSVSRVSLSSNTPRLIASRTLQ